MCSILASFNIWLGTAVDVQTDDFKQVGLQPVLDQQLQ